MVVSLPHPNHFAAGSREKTTSCRGLKRLLFVVFFMVFQGSRKHALGLCLWHPSFLLPDKPHLTINPANCFTRFPRTNPREGEKKKSFTSPHPNPRQIKPISPKKLHLIIDPSHFSGFPLETLGKHQQKSSYICSSSHPPQAPQ